MESGKRRLGRLSLSIFEIIDAFPEEEKTVDREINRINQELAPWLDHIKDIKEDYIDDFERFFFIEVIKIYMPKDKKEHLEMLYKIKKLYKSIRLKKFTLKDLKINEVKEIRIETLYAFNKIKKTSNRITCCCPFHEDKTPSFIINKNNTFKCFSCQAYGDSIDFIMKLNSLNFIEAVKFLTGKG